MCSVYSVVDMKRTLEPRNTRNTLKEGNLGNLWEFGDRLRFESSSLLKNASRLVDLSALIRSLSLKYRDGHVEFMAYPGEWPMTETTMAILNELDALGPESRAEEE